MEKNENGYSEYRLGTRGGVNGNGNGNVNGGTGRGSGCGCGCGSQAPGTNGGMAGEMCGGDSRQLAMVYSPYQCWRMLYTPSEALKHGTLFEELYKPLGECKNG